MKKINGFTFTNNNKDYFIITSRTRRTVGFLRDVLRIFGVTDPDVFALAWMETALQPATLTVKATESGHEYYDISGDGFGGRGYFLDEGRTVVINFDQPDQEYSSADTSINDKKRPALYGQVADLIDGANAVLDYGCGKFFDAYHMPAKVSGYDPFNRDAIRNGAAIAREYDLIMCANVLNVIKEDAARAAVLEDIAQHLTPSGVACFSIYEGDRSGNGRVTMRGCYQLNRKAAAYRAELERVFPVVRRVRGHYECRTA